MKNLNVNIMAKDNFSRACERSLDKRRKRKNHYSMERVNFYQNKIQEVLTEYLADLRQPANKDIDFVPISDKEKNHFQIIAMGWEKDERIFNLLFHLDIIGDKIWVQEDKMEESIAEKLVEKGLSKKDIVLAYFPDYHRSYTEYAVS